MEPFALSPKGNAVKVLTKRGHIAKRECAVLAVMV